MAKGFNRPAGGKMGGGGGGMMDQLRKMQEQMARIQEQLAEETVTATVGGGAVSSASCSWMPTRRCSRT